MFRIIPALKITGGDHIRPYAKFGFVIGTGTSIKFDVNGIIDNALVSGTEELSGHVSTGWLGAFGVDFRANDKLSVFIEVNAITQSWIPEKDVSRYSYTAGNITTTETETHNFVDVVPYNSSGLTLAPVEPFSSLGINAGIKLLFGGSN